MSDHRERQDLIRLGAEEARVRCVQEAKHTANIFRREGRADIAIALDALAQRLASLELTER